MTSSNLLDDFWEYMSVTFTDDPLEKETECISKTPWEDSGLHEAVIASLAKQKFAREIFKLD